MPTDQPPGPYICWPLIDGFTASTSGFTADNPFDNFCGTIENNSWFSISPCGSQVKFSIQSYDCQLGYGIQAAIYNKNFDLVSSCYSSMGSNFYGEIESANLIPGEIYYVMVDGFLGDDCEYTITALEGISPPSSEVLTESIEGTIVGRTEVCNGDLAPYQVAPPSCVHETNTGSNCPIPDLSAYYDTTYYWSLPPGASIIGNSSGPNANIYFNQNFEGGTISVSMEVQSLIPGCNDVSCASGMAVGTCTDIINEFYVGKQPPIPHLKPPVNICYGECYDFRGTTYCNPGRYEVEVELPLDCDSLIIFELFIKDQAYEDLGMIDLCGQECFEIDGQFFCENGYYEVPLVSVNGCDSLVSFEIEKYQHYNQQLGTFSICENTCFNFDGIDYCQTGSYQRNYSTSNGCDSTVNFQVKVLAEIKDTLPVQYTCPGDCITLNNNQYCGEGEYSFTTLSKEGCDSLVTFEVKYLQKDSVQLGTIAICDATCFELNGQTYCNAGIYQQNFTNALGCDSVVHFKIEKRNIDFEISRPSLLQTEDSSQVRLETNLQGVTDHLIYFWTGPGIHPSNQTKSNPLVSEPGLYELIVTDTLTGCEKIQQVEVKKNQIVCTGPSVELSGICETAPFLCGDVLQGYCATTTTPDTMVQPLPGNLNDILAAPLENPRWATWHPCDTDVSLKLATFNCLKDKGTEWSVLVSEDCQNFEVIIDSKSLENESVEEVNLTDLEPGQTYVFIWDGKDGDICDFQIEVTNGLSTAPVQLEQVEPGKILGETRLCPGAVQTYNLVAPVCRLSTGNCNLPEDLVTITTEKVNWNIPSFARFVGDSTGSTITIEIAEEAFIPTQPPFPPSGVLFNGTVSAEIETAASLERTASCGIENNLLTVVPIPLEIRHELVMKKPIDVCSGSTIERCGQSLSEEGYLICREACTTIVQPVRFKKMDLLDYGVRQICQGDYYVLPMSNDTLFEPGVYERSFSRKCGGLEKVILEYYPRNELKNGPITEICNPFHSYYTISFDIVKGEPPYFVNGESIPGVRFISEPIPNGTVYDFVIEDSGPCPSQKLLNGIFDCGPLCGSEAGEMSKTQIETCGYDPVKGALIETGTLDGDDGFDFILHTSASADLGNVLDRDTSGTFVFDPDVMEYDQVYYISQIIGNDEGDGVDLDDPCLAISKGQPVIFRQLPSYHIADTFHLNCNAEPITISGDLDTAYSYISWTTPDGQSSTGPSIQTNEPGTIGLFATTNRGCTLEKTITVVPSTDYPVALAGPDLQWYCNTEELILDASNSYGTNPLQFSWSTPDGNILSDPSSPSVVIGKPGNYMLEVTDLVNACKSTDMVHVSPITNRIESATIEKINPSCNSIKDGHLIINHIEGGTSPFEYSLDGAPFISKPEFAYLQGGMYNLVIRDANNCTLEKNIILEDPPVVDVQLGDDKIIPLGKQITLTAASSIIPTGIYWWNDSGEEYFDSSTWTIKPKESAVYHVRIEDQNGCLGEDKVRVFVQETSIYIPNAFSPNGDNKNDFFTVYVGESVAKISYLKVFDRKGELVFERKDFFPDDEQKGWDGSFRGKRMDPNVFVYLVEVEFINGNKRLFKGDVTLLR